MEQAIKRPHAEPLVEQAIRRQHVEQLAEQVTNKVSKSTLFYCSKNLIPPAFVGGIIKDYYKYRLILI